MKLYPAIDLHDGKAVRLYKGDYNQVTDYGDPKTQALKWQSMGATFLHLVDLDGAKNGGFKNLDAVKAILSTGIEAELGGGIRSLEQIDTTHGWLNTSDIEATDFANRLKKICVKTIIFTDIAKDGTLEGINTNQTKMMIDNTNLDVVASGGAKSLNDIERAKEIGCYGIILGKSLYSNQIDLKEAILKYED